MSSSRLRQLIYVSLALVMGAHSAAQEVATSHPATFHPATFHPTTFERTSIQGTKIVWDKTASLHVFCFLGVECPVARLYAARLQSLENQLKLKGVRFLGISSNLQDSKADLTNFAMELGLKFPLIQDSDQSMVHMFRATRTAEVIVMDSQGQIRYRGRIDDQFAPGVKRSKPSSNELIQAIDELLAGKPVMIPNTQPAGCLISLSRIEQVDAPVTYTKTIAPIFYRHCVECHRPNEIGPFDISDYSELRGWADMIVEVIQSKRMPPWHASSEHGEFKNARNISADEVKLIEQWVAAGTPYGKASELPELPGRVEGWRLDRPPEKIVPMGNRAFHIPAQGSVDYQYFVVDPGLDEDRWVSAAQVVPGNTAIVHHAIVFVRPPEEQDFQGIGWLTAYVPGQRATQFPKGYARRIPAGSQFVFQMHYTPNGTEQTDLTRIGMNFIDESEVTHEVFTLVGIDQEFEIPPGASDHAVNASVPWLPKNGELLAAMPHMHLRGKSFQLRARSSVQDSILLEVPHYDFDWQHTYEFAKPVKLSEIEQLEFTATFDNSPANPFNPAADEYVMWGDQTWEEMAVAFFEVARPRHQEVIASQALERVIAQDTKSVDPPSSDQVQFADDFLKRFDRNKDAQASYEEVPRIIQMYSFYQFDTNRDRMISRDELIAASKARRGK